MPRNQQYLTIGRSTNNNMTLRYRTVSQLHAKIKYQDVSATGLLVCGCFSSLELNSSVLCELSY